MENLRWDCRVMVFSNKRPVFKGTRRITVEADCQPDAKKAARDAMLNEYSKRYQNVTVSVKSAITAGY
jgi:hypothetical protein